MNQRFNRQPSKDWMPFLQNKRLPESSHSAITICKRMDTLELIMEPTAFNQRMILRLLHPRKKLFHLEPVYFGETCCNHFWIHFSHQPQSSPKRNTAIQKVVNPLVHQRGLSGTQDSHEAIIQLPSDTCGVQMAHPDTSLTGQPPLVLEYPGSRTFFRLPHKTAIP